MSHAPPRVRVVALGNPHRGDDGAALHVASRLREEASVVTPGRPGPALLDHFVPGELHVLMDVVVSGAPPGTIHDIDLDDLGSRLKPGTGPSSHGFGPAEALALADALGRPLPKGVFLGIEGESFIEGAPLSPAVQAALPYYEERIRSALRTLGRDTP